MIATVGCQIALDKNMGMPRTHSGLKTLCGLCLETKQLVI